MAMNTKNSAVKTEFEQLLECLKTTRMAGDGPFAGLLEIAGETYSVSSDEALGPE